MPDQNLKKDIKKTYLTMIKNSVGTKIFNSLFVKNQKTGEEYDVLAGGEYSCALYVSGILALVGLLDRPHATVATVQEPIQNLTANLRTQQSCLPIETQ